MKRGLIDKKIIIIIIVLTITHHRFHHTGHFSRAHTHGFQRRGKKKENFKVEIKGKENKCTDCIHHLRRHHVDSLSPCYYHHFIVLNNNNKR